MGKRNSEVNKASSCPTRTNKELDEDIARLESKLYDNYSPSEHTGYAIGRKKNWPTIIDNTDIQVLVNLLAEQGIKAIRVF